MSSRPVVAAQRHSVVAISAVALIVALLVTVVVAVAADWSPARADSSYDVVVVEDFSSPKAEKRFVTSGRGSWRVERGSYVLDAGVSAQGRKATAPLAVMRRKVKGSTWRLESTDPHPPSDRIGVLRGVLASQQ